MSHARADVAHLVEATIAAVGPELLVPRRLTAAAGRLLCDGRPFPEPVDLGGRIEIVGGGKAAAGMAAALEAVLEPAAGRRLGGLVSVPQGCGRRLGRVEVRETRPAGMNLPTAAAVAATREMRTTVAELQPDDLAIVVVTGGGSALLEDPHDGVSLAGLIAVTRFLSAAGADIRELNLVRQALSGVKAGGFARACKAGRLVALVLSDVIGDPLDMIASGPCMPAGPDPVAALAILRRHGGVDAAADVTRWLERAAAAPPPLPLPLGGPGAEWTTPSGCRVSHLLLGTNATAVDAAARAARRLGYAVEPRHAVATVETAESVGRRLAAEARVLAHDVARDGRPRAVIEGGEAVVTVPGDHGTGGRNQQTVLAAIEAWRREGGAWPVGLAVASLGTDGEDGPTDAAGGIADDGVARRLADTGIDLARAVARCDAYAPLAAADGLIRTGPTGTNVADVRIMLARP